MAITQTGPLTKDPNRLALGLAQIRVALSTVTSGQAGYVGAYTAVLQAANSMGAMASTKLMIEREYFSHEAGFPLLQDAQLPIRENASLECAFEEIDPLNMNIAAGKDPWTDGSGQLPIGAMELPAYVRMEAHYTYPNQDSMYVIFPRAQVLSNTELDLKKEENTSATVTFKANRADSGVTGGHSVWNSCPLGRIYWS